MIEAMVEQVQSMPRFSVHGRATRVVGLVIEATGLDDVALGELCRVTSLSDEHSVLAEVMGFHERGVLLMPLGDMEGIHPGSQVEPMGRTFGVDVGPGLLGRVLGGLGHPIDGKGDVGPTRRLPLTSEPPNPLARNQIEVPLETGVRALDGMLTLGRGQRVGIFAGSGVGKSTLLGTIARHSSADVNVIALLGERGREVRDFLENALREDGLARSVVVVATGDEAALIQARGALVATSIAEYFRDQGKQVLLMVDSITRVAGAWRQIGLAAGEPPTTKGYPPSVFAALPRLLERAGNAEKGGISGVYTVLVEGDDFSEPVADATRSILDGHIVLSREMSEAGRFPAIDVLASKSRVRDSLLTAREREDATTVARIMSARREKEDLISVGAYQPGSNADVDAAIRLEGPLAQFFLQEPEERTSYAETRDGLASLAVAAAGEGLTP